MVHVTPESVIQQHPTEDTLRKQVNYEPKRQAKHNHGPKRAGPNPRTKAHTLMTQSLTVDTANALMQLLPRLSPRRADGSSPPYLPPPPPHPTSLHTGTRGQGLCTPCVGWLTPTGCDGNQTGFGCPRPDRLSSDHGSTSADPVVHEDTECMAHCHAWLSFLV